MLEEMQTYDNRVAIISVQVESFWAPPALQLTHQ